MLQYQCIEPDTLRLLHALMNEEVLCGTRLVGGTGLALQYGHRISVDLDLFGQVAADSQAVREAVRRAGSLTIIKETPKIKLYIVDGVKVDIVCYDYPWIDGGIEEDGLRIASDRDIAAMKINAIEGRGTKKDFLDLYFVLQHYSLAEVIALYKKKYKEHSVFRALMSLTYFEDAEGQVPPRLFMPADWKDVKAFVSAAVQAFSGRD